MRQILIYTSNNEGICYTYSVLDNGKGYQAVKEDATFTTLTLT